LAKYERLSNCGICNGPVTYSREEGTVTCKCATIKTIIPKFVLRLYFRKAVKVEA